MCDRCGREAEFSVCCLMSTKGKRPRRQKCSRAVALCASCIRGLVEQAGCEMPPSLQRALSGVYTAVADPSDADAQPEKHDSDPSKETP